MSDPIRLPSAAERRSLALFWIDQGRARLVSGRLTEASKALDEAMVQLGTILSEREAGVSS